MTLDTRDLVILTLIVLNIVQVFLARGHIPPALVDKLFEFAAAKAAQTSDTQDDKTIAELRSIANALLNAQPPETAQSAPTETPRFVGSTDGVIPLKNADAVTTSADALQNRTWTAVTDTAPMFVETLTPNPSIVDPLAKE